MYDSEMRTYNKVSEGGRTVWHYVIYSVKLSY